MSTVSDVGDIILYFHPPETINRIVDALDEYNIILENTMVELGIYKNALDEQIQKIDSLLDKRQVSGALPYNTDFIHAFINNTAPPNVVFNKDTLLDMATDLQNVVGVVDKLIAYVNARR